MSTNLQIDDKLIVEATRLGGHKTKRDAVTQALVQYIQSHKQPEIINLFGKVEYIETYNYKQQRKKI